MSAYEDLSRRAQELWAGGRWEETLEVLRQLEGMNPESTEIAYSQAVCLVRLGKHAEARALLVRILQRKADDPDALALLQEAVQGSPEPVPSAAPAARPQSPASSARPASRAEPAKSGSSKSPVVALGVVVVAVVLVGVMVKQWGKNGQGTSNASRGQQLARNEAAQAPTQALLAPPSNAESAQVLPLDTAQPAGLQAGAAGLPGASGATSGPAPAETAALGAQVLYPIKQGTNFGYMNAAAQVVVEPRYSEVAEFHDGMGRVNAAAPVKRKSVHFEPLPLYGYVDASGRVAIPPRYTWAEDFSCGFARVTDDPRGIDRFERNLFLIDKQGNRQSFVPGAAFSEGLAVKEIRAPVGVKAGRIPNSKAGYVDASGRVIFARESLYTSGLGRFSEGLARFLGANQKWGFLNTEGLVTVPPAFNEATDFHDGVAAVLVGRPGQRDQPAEWGYVDRQGRLAIPAIYKEARGFSEGVGAVLVEDIRGNTHYPDKWLCIDPTGRTLFEAGSAGEPGHCRGGLIRVKEISGWRVVDKTGREVFKWSRGELQDFIGGLARVVADGSWAYLDMQGKIVWAEDLQRLGIISDLETYRIMSDPKLNLKKTWGVQIFGPVSQGQTTAEIYSAPASPPANADSFVFRPQDWKLLARHKPDERGICVFPGLSPPFFLYITNPGCKPEWRWVSSTEKWYHISLISLSGGPPGPGWSPMQPGGPGPPGWPPSPPPPR